jgi:hypothetical protein
LRTQRRGASHPPHPRPDKGPPTPNGGPSLFLLPAIHARPTTRLQAGSVTSALRDMQSCSCRTIVPPVMNGSFTNSFQRCSGKSDVPTYSSGREIILQDTPFRIVVRCLRCGRGKNQHRAVSLQCPQGKRTPIGYTQFSVERFLGASEETAVSIAASAGSPKEKSRSAKL